MNAGGGESVIFKLFQAQETPPTTPHHINSDGVCLSNKTFSGSLTQQSPNFLAPGTRFVEDNFSTDQGQGDGFRMIQAHYTYCALYFYYYYFVIYNEIIIQLTIMQNQWEP